MCSGWSGRGTGTRHLASAHGSPVDRAPSALGCARPWAPPGSVRHSTAARCAYTPTGGVGCPALAGGTPPSGVRPTERRPMPGPGRGTWS
ncbi:hypothetical protein E6W17_38680 [Streptomyces sp. A1547]|nr:hypothetical protein E6W17_38680 [Streptomyces sp. A1547]